MTVSTNPYASQSISAYNTNPPPDDGTTGANNLVTWDKHKTKLADPIKTLAEAIDSQNTTAFAKTINADAGERNQIDGSVAFAWATATIGNSIVTPLSSAAYLSGATTDTVFELRTGSVYDGAVLSLKTLSASDNITLLHATATTAATATAANIYLRNSLSAILDDQYKTIDLIYDSGTASGWVEKDFSSGTWEFVSTEAITAATSLVVTGMAAGYDYIIQLEAFCPTDDDEDIQLRFSDDDGSNYEEDANDYEFTLLNLSTSQQWSSTDSATAFWLNGTLGFGNDAGNQSTLEILLPNPNASSEPSQVMWRGGYSDTAATPLYKILHGAGSFAQGNDAVSAVQFTWSAGSTFKAQGDITVYRRRRS